MINKKLLMLKASKSAWDFRFWLACQIEAASFKATRRLRYRRSFLKQIRDRNNMLDEAREAFRERVESRT